MMKRFKALPGKALDKALDKVRENKPIYENGLSQNDLERLIEKESIQKIIGLNDQVTASFHVGIASDKVESASGPKTAIPELRYQITSDSYLLQKSEAPQLLFAIGSLMKTLINVCLYRMIEHGAGLDHKVREIMKAAWEKNAFTLFNELRTFREHEVISVPFSTTISLENLLHHRGLDPMNQHLFVQNGKFLMSNEKFKKSIVSLTNAHHTKAGEWKYSNCNHMLAALIICEATGGSLADALQKMVLDEFGMGNTILDLAKFKKKQAEVEELSKIASPHVIDMSGNAHVVDWPKYFHDDVELAAGGGYSCTEDFAKLFRVLMAGYGDEDSIWRKFFDRGSKYDDGKDSFGCHMCGISTFVHSSAIGIQALDPTAKLINPVKRLSLGKAKNPKYKLFIKAGAVKGYNCHHILVPDLRMFIIIFTNASGIIDASYYIGLYILKQILQTRDKVDVVEEAQRIRDETRKVLKASLLDPEKESGFEKSEVQAFKGTFKHEATDQVIAITVHENQKDLNVSVASDSEALEGAPLRLVKDSEKIVKESEKIIRIVPRNGCDYGPDTYVAWWGLRFESRTSETTGPALLVTIDESRGRRVETKYEKYSRISA